MAEKTAAERVALARHPQRPNITDYIDGLFTDFFEQRGDRKTSGATSECRGRRATARLCGS